MKHFRLAGLPLLLIAQAVPAQSYSYASTQNWGPNGNGTLDHKDDLQWLVFHDTRITADPAAGIYSARFGPFLQKMEGTTFIITGYMMALGATMATNHFVLTRRSPGCPFCPPNEPTEAIEVFSQTLIKPTQAPITVEGRLHFVANSQQGLFFRIDSAKTW